MNKKPSKFLKSETDLHKEVVKFIRANYPELLIDAGLGELQDSSEKRIYKRKTRSYDF